MGRMKGNQKSLPGVYRDDPDRDDAASTSSAVALRDHAPFVEEDQEDGYDEPPAYSDESDVLHTELDGNIRSGQSAPRTLDAKIEEWTIEDKKGSTYTRLSSSLTTDPVALKEYILYQASVIPTAYIQIHGQHTESSPASQKEKKKQVVVDFCFKINVTDTIALSYGSNHQGEVPEKATLQTLDNGLKAYRGTPGEAQSEGIPCRRGSYSDPTYTG